MDTFAELVAAVQSDLTIGAETSFITPITVKLAINRAYRKAGGLVRWPETEDSKTTSTVLSQEYYDYPDNWRPDSMWKLKVDNVRYGEGIDGSPLVFSDFLNFKEDYPDSLEKKWSTQWRRYFISPIPSTDGNNNIEIWGQKVVDKLVNDADVTIFTYSLPECNDAIVMEAEAILKRKADQAQEASTFFSPEAKQILLVAWNKIKQENDKNEKNEPMFNVPDMFKHTNASSSTDIGDFIRR